MRVIKEHGMVVADILQLQKTFPIIERLAALEEVSWFNPNCTSVNVAVSDVGLDQSDIKDASDRLRRFAPYIAQVFPDTSALSGIIESEVVELFSMKSTIERQFDVVIPGRLMLKKDSHLPISGSIKARGGIYEVLTHAEKLAIDAGLLTKKDDYRKLASDDFKTFFSQYSIAVGSTGNLGLSIGIISAELGFSVSVHMSADAKEWKKRKLRSHGVTVVEYQEDYSVAVEQGRKEAQKKANRFFIDDENSQTLFLGYSVAGERLKAQFVQQGITVDQEHPLFVYLPCGVGGGPGGVAFGLKMAFGDSVHCIFAEPTHSPCMLLGVYTGLHDKICVQDIGIDNNTAADGLAVGRPSGFVGKAMARLLDGFYTISDENMYRFLGILNQCEGIQLEPSALAGMMGPVIVSKVNDNKDTYTFSKVDLSNATHLVWATGGGMVPEKEMSEYLALADRNTNLSR